MKYIALVLMFAFASFNLSAQSKMDQEEINEKMDEAITEMQKAMDTLDIQKLFEEGMALFNNEDSSKELRFLMDSLDMEKLFGGDFSKLFGEDGLPGMEGIDMNQFNEMMDQSMKMFENMDPKMMEDMMKGFDFDELNKMFENMDLDQFKNMTPTTPSTDKKKKGLKKA